MADKISKTRNTPDESKPVQQSLEAPFKPTPEDLDSLNRYIEKRKRKPPVFRQMEGREVTLGSTPEDKAFQFAKLAEAMGTPNQAVIDQLLGQVFDTFTGADASADVDKLNTVVALLFGIKPRDELECMLAVQMVGAHNAAMEFLRRAMAKDQTFEGTTENVHRATKLMRTFTAQMEALNKYRGKGQQKMVVEHVHVNAGGQAVVGVLNHGEEGHEKK